MMNQRKDNERYNRQLQLKEWSMEAQLKLANSAVLIVGAGALGCAVLPYLVAAGVGKIGIVDGDKIELTNLHRQVLYTENEIGKSKTKVAAEKMRELNSSILIEEFDTYFTAVNAFEISFLYDLIVDGTDNFPTRYLVNDLCVLTSKINVHGSIDQFTGQVALFNALENGERTGNYRDIFPQPPKPEQVKNCAESGVIGALPGIIGSMMALETIKVMAGLQNPLSNRIFQIDSLSYQTQTLKYRKDINNPLTRQTDRQTKLIDYEMFCGINKSTKMKSITPTELKEWQTNKIAYQLIDVREPQEFDEVNMDGVLIPMQQIPARMDEINKDGNVVIHCRSGARSANVIQYLNQHGYDNLYNLEGGIIAWMAQN